MHSWRPLWLDIKFLLTPFTTLVAFHLAFVQTNHRSFTSSACIIGSNPLFPVHPTILNSKIFLHSIHHLHTFILLNKSLSWAIFFLEPLTRITALSGAFVIFPARGAGRPCTPRTARPPRLHTRRPMLSHKRERRQRAQHWSRESPP